jgi:5-(carboxyamino)imidazole ribonucleotide synthase
VNVILPGSRIGILGGGQLARMLSLAAKPMGYKVIVLDPDPNCPTSSVCDEVIAAKFDDAVALEKLAALCDVVTLEFENVPASGLAILEAKVPLRPSAKVLEIARNRILEKQFLNDIGVATAPWADVRVLEDLEPVISIVGLPAILKTATLGYDGKGQAKVSTLEEAQAAFSRFGMDCVLEGLVEFDLEISVIVARSSRGEVRAFAPFENAHANGILDVTTIPANIPESITREGEKIALEIAAKLEVIGLLTIEMFVTKDARVLVNELAPRPHNSGHLTIEACPTSQFEQAIRAVCGLPLGNVTTHSPAAMVNLLGDLWQNAVPNWNAALEIPNSHSHLYGKLEARAGRKMGHITVLGETVQEARDAALKARDQLTKP